MFQRFFDPLVGYYSPLLQDYQAIVDAEWQIIFQKLQALADTSAKVVLSKLPIGDLATQYALLTAMLLLDSPTNH
jgi:hypothetical protein